MRQKYELLNPNLSRVESEEQFWDEVKGLLTDTFGREETAASRGIDSYKVIVRQFSEDGYSIPEVVYNQGQQKTAEIVNRVLDN